MPNWPGQAVPPKAASAMELEGLADLEAAVERNRQSAATAEAVAKKCQSDMDKATRALGRAEEELRQQRAKAASMEGLTGKAACPAPPTSVASTGSGQGILISPEVAQSRLAEMRRRLNCINGGLTGLQGRLRAIAGPPSIVGAGTGEPTGAIAQAPLAGPAGAPLATVDLTISQPSV